MDEAGHELIINTRCAPRRPDPMHACVKNAHERKKHATVAARGVSARCFMLIGAHRALLIAVPPTARPRHLYI